MTLATEHKTMVRLVIGFSAGATLSVRVDGGEADRMRVALDAGRSWHRMETDDGATMVALHHLAYLQLDDGDQRLGFA